eukprot:TRINITY_DN122924_c0_g1_i1.p1 TRINITY_DN122924_c0_g1~~TRINITY_DN122924_c0_g1_i1.p1  ORF type:complete len:260 (-),score=59.56 TRINITY_DN122924_c0_g1_i1:90-869(-)
MAQAQEVPHWIMEKVNATIAAYSQTQDHHIHRLAKDVSDVASRQQQLQGKMEELTSQMAVLARCANEEQERGRDRDEQLNRLSDRVVSTSRNAGGGMGMSMVTNDRSNATMQQDHALRELVQKINQDIKTITYRTDELQRHMEEAINVFGQNQTKVDRNANGLAEVRQQVKLLEQKAHLLNLGSNSFSLKSFELDTTTRETELNNIQKKYALAKERVSQLEAEADRFLTTHEPFPGSKAEMMVGGDPLGLPKRGQRVTK